jgi:hypothetical protein
MAGPDRNEIAVSRASERTALDESAARKRPATGHVAIDLGRRESQVCVRAEDGTILEEKRCSTRELGLSRKFTRPRAARSALRRGPTLSNQQKKKVKGTLPVPTVPAAPAPQTVQTAAPAVVSTPAPVAVASAPVIPAPAPANGVAPVQNGAPHA